MADGGLGRGLVAIVEANAMDSLAGGEAGAGGGGWRGRGRAVANSSDDESEDEGIGLVVVITRRSQVARCAGGEGGE